MTAPMSYEQIKTLSDKILDISEKILFTMGPFLKEGIYQDILVSELQSQNMETIRELVFNYKFTNSEGKYIPIGNNQSLRSDIELPQYLGILELKSSGSSTKDENVWQLRNYLENRDDRHWGLVINFVSKFGPKTHPKVEISLLIKKEYLDREESRYQIQTRSQKKIKINKYYLESWSSLPYPKQEDILIPYIQNSNVLNLD